MIVFACSETSCAGCRKDFYFRKTERMPLKTALTDLSSTTLAAIVGTLGKIRYLAELRREPASYDHWGMVRVHGEANAQGAFAKAHQSAFLRTLRTPLEELLDDAGVSAQAINNTRDQFLGDLQSRSSALIPPDRGGGSIRHFMSVLHALVALANQPKPPTPPIS